MTDIQSDGRLWPLDSPCAYIDADCLWVHVKIPLQRCVVKGADCQQIPTRGRKFLLFGSSGRDTYITV
jgi:hypothetical protein